MREPLNNEWSVSGSGAYACWESPRDGGYQSGCFHSELGTVNIYRYPASALAKQAMTQLKYVSHGRLYVRNFWRGYSTRYCVTLARRFAREISELPRPMREVTR